MAKTKRAKAIPHYVVLKWDKNHPMIDPMYPIKKEWEIIKEYDDTFQWDSVLYQVWYFNTHAQGITVNGYMSQDTVLRVLLHEMVHIEQFILKNQNGDHGRYFKSRCRELTALTNKRYGVVK